MFTIRKQTVPCNADGSRKVSPSQSLECKYEQDGYYLDFGFIHGYLPMGQARPMSPSFRKNLERAFQRLEREKTTWRDWR
jgi:hypothetical protein